MSAPAFTPGPWSLKVHTGNGRDIGPKTDWSVQSPDGLGICFEGQTNPNAHADARLIAAAPELYEALELCVAMLHADNRATPDADAALAKAKGE